MSRQLEMAVQRAVDYAAPFLIGEMNEPHYDVVLPTIPLEYLKKRPLTEPLRVQWCREDFPACTVLFDDPSDVPKILAAWSKVTGQYEPVSRELETGLQHEAEHLDIRSKLGATSVAFYMIVAKPYQAAKPNFGIGSTMLTGVTSRLSEALVAVYPRLQRYEDIKVAQTLGYNSRKDVAADAKKYKLPRPL